VRWARGGVQGIEEMRRVSVSVSEFSVVMVVVTSDVDSVCVGTGE
jgi:hypothetical protein